MVKMTKYRILAKTEKDVFTRTCETSADPREYAWRVLSFDPYLIEVSIFKGFAPVIGRTPIVTLHKRIGQA